MAGINQFFGVPLQKYFLGSDIDLNKDQAGVYGAVQKIPALLAMFTTAYNYAAEPFFFRNADRKDSNHLYGDIALFFTIVAGLVVLGIFFFIDVFQYFIGPSFREGLFIIPFLLISYLLLGLYYNVSIWYKLSDNTIYGAGIATVGAIITLAVNMLFLPTSGIIASAYAALACYGIMVVLAYFLGQVKYPINYPVRSIIIVISLITLLICAGSFLRQPSSPFNFSLGLIALIIYVTIIYLLERKKINYYFKGQN